MILLSTNMCAMTSLLLVLIILAVSTSTSSGGGVRVTKIKDGKLVSEGDCENSVGRSILMDLERKVQAREEARRVSQSTLGSSKTTKAPHQATTSRKTRTDQGKMTTQSTPGSSKTTKSPHQATTSRKTRTQSTITSIGADQGKMTTQSTPGSSKTIKTPHQATTSRNTRTQSMITSIGAKMTPMDCSEVATYYTNVSWAQIYPLKNIGDLRPYTVRCSQDGWTVIQRRDDGSLDFDRDWESYARGFGNIEAEFWLGLRAMHALTSTKNYTLRVDLRRTDGTPKYAEYSTFRVGDEEDGFRLTVSGYTGNAVDGLRSHDGDRFSSKDRDLDTSSGNCAVDYEGAFWYHACYSANLNGKYGTQFYWIVQLSFSEMKIRRA